MSTPSDTVTDAPQSTPPTPASLPRLRLLYWSLRRELWENRAFYIAPLAVAAVVLFGFGLGALGVVHHSTKTVQRTVITETTTGAATQATHAVAVAPPLTEAQKALLATFPYDFTAAALVVTMLIVAVFYCLGALHNERRDRSILFWKSLPVPDVTAVAAKAILPLVIMPLTAMAITVATLALMLGMAAAGLTAHGKGLDEISRMPIGPLFGVVLYGIAVLTLWWAPIYGWLLMVSAWAKRAPFLWAFLPPLLLAVTEQIALGSDHLGSLIQYRLFGAYPEGFVVPTHAELVAHNGLVGMPVLDPGKFFAAPALWEGLAVAVAFIAAAVWLRRYREPT